MTNDRSKVLCIATKITKQLDADGFRTRLTPGDKDLRIWISPPLVRKPPRSRATPSLVPKVMNDQSEGSPKMMDDQSKTLRNTHDPFNKFGDGASIDVMRGNGDICISTPVPLSLGNKSLWGESTLTLLSDTTKDQSEALPKVTKDQFKALSEKAIDKSNALAERAGDRSEALALRITHTLLNQLGADCARINVTAVDENICILVPFSPVGGSTESGAATKTSITLRADRGPSLWNLLTDKYPSNLGELWVMSGGDPSTIFFPPRDQHPRYSLLTSFKFESSGSDIAVSLGEYLLQFLGNCPRLEVLFLNYYDPKQVIKFKTSPRTKRIHLDSLRSFTHESYVRDEVTPVPVPVDLFNQLILKATCNITFTIKNPPRDPWDCSFPALLRDTSHLSSVNTVRIAIHPLFKGAVISSPLVVGATFSNPEHAFAFNAIVYSYKCPRKDGINNMLDFLEKCRAVKTLHFERCIEKQNVKEVLGLVKDNVVRRRERRTHLESVVLDVQSKEKFSEAYRESIDELRKFIFVQVGVKDSRV